MLFGCKLYFTPDLSSSLLCVVAVLVLHTFHFSEGQFSWLISELVGDIFNDFLVKAFVCLDFFNTTCMKQ